MYRPLIRFLTISFIIFKVIFKSKNDLLLENIALRQQLSTYLIKKTKPKLTDLDRSFWIVLKHIFGKWRDSLVIVSRRLSSIGRTDELRSTGPKYQPKTKNLVEKESRRKFEISFIEWLERIIGVLPGYTLSC